MRGVAVGIAIITARTGTGRLARIARTVVTVATVAPRVAAVVVSPSDAYVQVGSRLPFIAVAYDTANNAIVSDVFRWSSANPRAATIDQNGTATGVGPGVTIITARVGTGRGARVGQATLQVGAATRPPR